MPSQPGTFNVQEFTDAGAPLVSGRLYTYAYGTTTQKVAYTDAAGLVPHTYTLDASDVPYIALNARGELPAPLYLSSGSYDLALKRADGSTVWTRRAEGANVDQFTQAGTGAVLRSTQDKMREVVSIADFGAVANGTAYATTGGTDSGPAINAAITAAAALGRPATVFIPDGVWNVATAITQLPNVSISMSDGAVLNVTAAIDAVITTPVAQLLEEVFLRGGKIYCNGLANYGVYWRCFRHYHAKDTIVEDFLVAGYVAGDPAQAFATYGLVFHNLRTHRRSAAVPAGTIGMWVRAATDSQGLQSEFVGAEVGFNCQSGGSFNQIHCWTRASTGAMKTGFLFTGGGAQIINCYADTPTLNGYDLTGSGYVLVNPQTFNNNGTSATDNVATAIRLRTVNPNVTIIGPKSEGGDITHRLKNDLVTADFTMNGVTWLAPVNINTVSTTRPVLASGECVVNGTFDQNRPDSATNLDRVLMTNMAARYVERLSGSETGANAGGNYALISRNDDGSLLRGELANSRSNGAWVFGDPTGLTTGLHLMYGAGFGIKTVGAGFRTAEGSNAKQGTATLVAGSSVVANTSVTATSRIFLTSQADGGTPGFLRVSARTAGTSFTITSSNAADTSTVAYEIFEPA
jgi:hypothetical protein